MINDRPTRRDQAIAILSGRGPQLARRILGRRPVSASDYAEALNAERIDLIAEIPNRDALLKLGRNRVGPANGLYILEEDDGSLRIYTQERGETIDERRGLDFDEARNEVIDRVILLSGLPYEPPG